MSFLSIVTVTYQDPQGLAKTLRSLRQPIPQGIEIIVVDGSPVESPIVSHTHRHGVAFTWIRGDDHGIYDAMNKGFRAASGKYIWFLNGGDESRVRDWNGLIATLVHALNCQVDMLLFGYEMQFGHRSLARQSRKPQYIRHGLPTSHQAILYRRSSMPEQGYPQGYRMAGDYALTARMLKDGASVRVEKMRIARFDTRGFSATHPKLIAAEARLIQETILCLPQWRVKYSRSRHFRSRLVRKLVRGLIR